MYVSIYILTICVSVVNALPETITYVGRIDFSQNIPRADWSGSGITAFITNPSDYERILTVTLNISSETENYVSVLIDCNVFQKFEVSPDYTSIQFPLRMEPRATKEITCLKVTEASQGTISFNDVYLSSGKFITSATTCRNPSNHRLLFVGDSNTVAYGVEGEDPCSFSPDTENVLDSYATFVANDLGSELHTIAWSGKGVVRNYADENTVSENPMPIYYNRTIGEESDPSLVWKPDNYTPDIVMIMLGANDYSTEPHPSDSDFVNGLVNLITQIQSDYPNAKIGTICSPHPNGNQCTNIQEAAAKMGATYTQVLDDVLVSYGCDMHPSIESQRNIADIITPVVQIMLESMNGL